MKLFPKLSKTANIMLFTVAGVCLVLLVVGLIVTLFIYPFEKPLAFALGLAAGGVMSLLKVVLLDRSIDHSVDMESKQAQNYARLQAIARYGLTLVFVAAIVVFPKVIGLFGAIMGMLSLQLGAYIANMVIKHKGISI